MELLKRCFLSDTLNTTTAHRDSSRKQVGSTAFAVAAFRAMEAWRSDPLVIDEVAAKVFAMRGPAPLLWRLAVAVFGLVHSCLIGRGTRIETSVDMLAVRTALLDAEIDAAALQQMVSIGAGLDARSLRLRGRPDRRWLEVDFASMHEAKWQLFGAAGFARPESLVCVNADLTEPRAWQRELLMSRGFDRKAPTLWLLEGLTGYLERKELLTLIALITEVSAPGSVLLATFLSATRPEGSVGGANKLKMHKFFTDTPMALFDDYVAGGGTVSELTIGEVATRFGRPSISAGDASYKFVRATRGGSDKVGSEVGEDGPRRAWKICDTISDSW
jgi:methyltransferase (TIGR00027 family)